MNPIAFSEEHLLSAAADGALILTATKRLARRLRGEFDRRLAAAGRAAWSTPAIASGDDWLRQAADRLGEGWRFLGSQGARRLWERIIDAEESESVQALLQVAATARAAEEAHTLLAEYRQNPASQLLTADHASFLRWRHAYLEICRRDGWLDTAALAETVSVAVAEGILAVPQVLWIAGFDDLPPRFRRLAEAFAARGGEVHEFPPAVEPAGEPVRLACADARDEVRQAARWARRLLEEGEGEIGIVVPDLQGYRLLIERIFLAEIDPAAQVRPGAEEARFSLSLGAPLADQGAVVAALEILGAGPILPVARAGFLLRTPYLGGSLRESTGRARLDRKLRAEDRNTVSLQTFARAMGKEEEANPRSIPFAAICHRLLDFFHDREKRLPGAWAAIFAGLLQAVGWPGERPLDSRDYQVVKAWREKVLRDLASFDLVSGPVARSEAVALVRRLAAETEFHSEGPESPVQVFGLLEAAGLRFRHLWVMGLHDGALPAPPRPNPFLPVSLQIAAGMPHASAEREAEFAGRVAARLLAAAPKVVLSHPLREGDAIRLPSPFIRDLPAGEVSLAPGHAPAAVWRRAAHAAEVIFDPSGPPLPADRPAIGGTAILRDQALCPFRSFARHRLAAASLEVPDIGLDAGERGSLLHKVLEIFWRETGDQAGLLALDAAALDLRLRRNIDEAIARTYEKRLRPSAALLDLEAQRLLLLVREWLLEVESRRVSFTVEEREKEHRETFGGIEFTTRIDRIDRLLDGSLAVIDYKTGQVEAADLIGERLLEPQLPVYGLGRPEGDLAAAAFATLRRGKCGFVGVARDGGLLPKVPALAEWKKAQETGIAEWPALLARWREQLDALGRAFAAGEAAVDPVSVHKACRICDLTSFCRIHEIAGLTAEGGEE